MRQILAILAICLISGGCAVGVTHRYDSAGATFGYETKSSVAVAVHDRRPYIVNGEKAPSFVGLSRGGFGNPFNINTASSNPLADDFADSIVSALKADDVTATAITVLPQDSETKVRSALLAANTKRFVLITLYEWKSDTYTNTALHFDVLLRVLDASGSQRAEKRLRGRDDLGGDFINPPGHSRKVVPETFKRKLEELFRDPGVSSALQ